MPVPEDCPYLVEIRRTSPVNSSREGYDALYSVASLSKIDSFYLWCLDQMQLPAGASLLDVSCGAGELVRLASRRGVRAMGIDFSQVVAQVAHRNVNPSVAVADGERLPFTDSSFDFVSNIGSLEHFLNPAQGALEMARVLRPGGRAFTLLPNTFGLLTTIWDAYRKGVTAADDQPLQRYGARADWQRLLAASGLPVCRVAGYEQAWPRSAMDWRYYLRHPKNLVRLMVAPLVPLNLSSCFLFTCELRGS
jgi:SAM-dependent methyltransferase